MTSNIGCSLIASLICIWACRLFSITLPSVLASFIWYAITKHCARLHFHKGACHVWTTSDHGSVLFVGSSLPGVALTLRSVSCTSYDLPNIEGEPDLIAIRGHRYQAPLSRTPLQSPVWWLSQARNTGVFALSVVLGMPKDRESIANQTIAGQ